MDDINTLRRILKESHVIAVVGLSADWYRPSYFAAKYMQEHGYRVVPVNPKYESILGEKCYRSLRDIAERVDIVDVFRKTQDVMPIAEDAIAIGAKVLWQQLGVRNEAAAAKARHMRARPDVSVAHVDGEKMAVFSHGRVEPLAEGDAEWDETLAHWTRHYGSSPLSWGDEIVLYRYTPHWMVGYAWKRAELMAERGLAV